MEGGERRALGVGVVQRHQLAAFLLEVDHRGAGQWFEGAPKARPRAGARPWRRRASCRGRGSGTPRCGRRRSTCRCGGSTRRWCAAAWSRDGMLASPRGPPRVGPARLAAVLYIQLRVRAAALRSPRRGASPGRAVALRRRAAMPRSSSTRSFSRQSGATFTTRSRKTRVPKNFCDLEARGGADPLDHLAALADEDRLLRRPVDQDAAGDAQQVPLGSAISSPALRRPVGRPVATSSNWSMVTAVENGSSSSVYGQHLLADQLGGDRAARAGRSGSPPGTAARPPAGACR